jgi:Neuraminidase (sialidase)
VLAVDPSSRYRDRVYCAWVDGPNRESAAIFFSSSDDRGSTWTPPKLLSEQPIDTDQPLWQADYPALAVNKDGVLAATFYDRRNQKPSKENTGYEVRLRISTDGGSTWTCSEVITERPGVGALSEVRGWVGMTTDRRGDFHPAWISDANGVQQVWTARVSVGQ